MIAASMFQLIISFLLIIPQNSLLGTWEMISETETLECPDYLKFTNDNTLEILNECYGDDLTITGTAHYEIKQNVITLSNLNYLTNYQPFNIGDTQKINFEIKSDTLLLTSKSMERKPEKYIRINK